MNEREGQELETKLRKKLRQQPALKRLPEAQFAEALTQLVANASECEAFFDALVLGPLVAAGQQAENELSPCTILVEGLDESLAVGDLAVLLKELFRTSAQGYSKLPAWVRLLITSRDEPAIAAMASTVAAVNVDLTQEPDANSDLNHFARSRLGAFPHKANEEVMTSAVDCAVAKSQGSYLYIETLAKEISSIHSTLRDQRYYSD